MEKKFIMTAFGKDRPGFVADISRVIYENECNLEDSTMTGISNEFALIILFSGREDGGLEDQLAKDCRRLERENGISAFIRPVSSEGPSPGAPRAWGEKRLAFMAIFSWLASYCLTMIYAG